MDRTTGTVDGAGAAPPGGEDPSVAEDFDSYVRASERRHKRLAFLLVGDPDTAEDLLQASYARLYPKWHRVRTYDHPDAYLRRVMVSLRTSWWRRHRNREWSVADITDVTGATAAPGAGAGADPTEGVVDSQLLLDALRQLPDRQRVAVVLRHWCDLSEADTAAAMSCSPGTVKSNTSKGLTRLRVVLADQHEHSGTQGGAA